VAGPNRVGDLQIDADLDSQRGEWRFERIGWAAMLLVVAATLLGAFGRGPLSRAEAGAAGGPLHLRYERLVRHNSPAPLNLELAPGAAPDGQARVWIDHDYLEQFDVDHIVPEPESSAAGPDRTTYVFRVADPTRPARITFGLVPQGFGRLRARVGLAGQPPVELSQFVFP